MHSAANPMYFLFCVENVQPRLKLHASHTKVALFYCHSFVRVELIFLKLKSHSPIWPIFPYNIIYFYIMFTFGDSYRFRIMLKHINHCTLRMKWCMASPVAATKETDRKEKSKNVRNKKEWTVTSKYIMPESQRSIKEQTHMNFVQTYETLERSVHTVCMDMTKMPVNSLLLLLLPISIQFKIYRV